MVKLCEIKRFFSRGGVKVTELFVPLHSHTTSNFNLYLSFSSFKEAVCERSLPFFIAKITYVITDQNNAVYTVQGNSGEEITFAIGDLAFNTEYTFSIVAKDDNENASAAQTVTATTTALVAAPVSTQKADEVVALYSDAYEAATTWYAGGWGQSTVQSEVTVGEDNILKFTSFNYFGFDGFANQLDLSDMNYLHIDILPMQAMSFGITPILVGPLENSTLVGDLTVGEWNSIDLPLTQFELDFTNKAFQLKIDRGTGVDVIYVDNIYFWKGDTTGINQLTAAPADTTVYDLQGRRVAQPARGLYIVNGRKVVLK